MARFAMYPASASRHLVGIIARSLPIVSSIIAPMNTLLTVLIMNVRVRVAGLVDTVMWKNAPPAPPVESNAQDTVSAFLAHVCALVDTAGMTAQKWHPT